jgi:hypothetical protein
LAPPFASFFLVSHQRYWQGDVAIGGDGRAEDKISGRSYFYPVLRGIARYGDRL